DYKQPKQILETNELHRVGLIGDKNSQANRVYDPNYISATIVGNAGGLGGKTGLYIEPIEAGAIRGRYDNEGKIKQQLELRGDGNTNAITTVQKDNVIVENRPFKIRKLTPLECFRLMGFTDEDYYISKKHLEDIFYNGRDRSDSQMYKMS